MEEKMNEKKAIIDFEQAFAFLMEALEAYHPAQGGLHSWLDELYVRLWEDARGISFDEIFTLSSLRMENGAWMPEGTANKAIEELLARLKAREPYEPSDKAEG